MSDVLTFQDISFGYGERKLFEGFSLAIPEGGITAVLGPNGCGKSTLLALAEGMLKPACGAVLLSGTDTLSLSAKERAGLLAMLPQVHRTPSMKVRDLVACGRYAHMGPFGQLEKADWDKVDEAISLMGLEGLRDRNARKLSGGGAPARVSCHDGRAGEQGRFCSMSRRPISMPGLPWISCSS